MSAHDDPHYNLSASIESIDDAQDYREYNRMLKAAIDYRLIGKRMQEARRQCHLTQASIAEQMHLGWKYYASLESGKISISFTRFIQFLTITQASADQILTGCIPGFPNATSHHDISEVREHIEQLLDRCSDGLLETVAVVIEGLMQQKR